MDTHSYPGHLMLKLLGPGLGTGFGPAGGSSLKLSDYPPPWEIETSFIAPDDSIPWNYWMNFIVIDKQGRNRGMWTPGVENDPKARRHRPFAGRAFRSGSIRRCPSRSSAHKPLAMLIQCIDDSHVRLGFRAQPGDPWHLSEVYDAKKAIGHRDRRLRHALLEHHDRPHVRGRPGRADVSEIPDRLRPLSLRPLNAFLRRGTSP